jgi:hypothetical protein
MGVYDEFSLVGLTIEGKKDAVGVLEIDPMHS